MTKEPAEDYARLRVARQPNMSLEGDRGFRCGLEALDINQVRDYVKFGGIYSPAPQLGVRMTSKMTKDQCIRIYDKACTASVHDKSMVLDHKYFDGPIRDESLTHDEIKDSISALLLEPLNANDASFVEAALGLIGRVGAPDNWLEILRKLVLDINHRKHEDIIGMLQD